MEEFIDPSSIDQAQAFGTGSTLIAASAAGAIAQGVSFGTPRVSDSEAFTSPIVLVLAPSVSSVDTVGPTSADLG